jgi:hypothetical protein
MLSSILGQRRTSRLAKRHNSLSSTPATERTSLLGAHREALQETRRVAHNYDNSDGDDDINEDGDEDDNADDDVDDDMDAVLDDEENDLDEDAEAHSHSPLLPLFEASQLGS